LPANSELLKLSSVEPYQFYNCKKLINVRLQPETSYVGERAFYNCGSITSILDYDPAERKYYKLSAIYDGAFEGCESMTSAFIPSDISILGNSTFKDCSGLSSLTINLNAEQFRDIVNPSYSVSQAVSCKFFDIREDARCRINFNDSVYMNNGVIKIDHEYVGIRVDGDISGVSSLNYDELVRDGQYYLNLSDIAEIDPFVFKNVELLEMINVHPGKFYLSSIGDYAFSKCQNLALMCNNRISASYIGKYAFAGCGQLEQL